MLRPELQFGVLWMSAGRGIVQIIGAPVACADGCKDSWREVAAWAAEQLGKRFGATIQVQYYDLFDPNCPPLPADAQLPIVIVNGDVISMGGKISLPLIRKRLEECGFQAIRS